MSDSNDPKNGESYFEAQVPFHKKDLKVFAFLTLGAFLANGIAQVLIGYEVFSFPIVLGIAFIAITLPHVVTIILAADRKNVTFIVVGLLLMFIDWGALGFLAAASLVQ